MVVKNLTSKNLNALMPNGMNLRIPGDGVSENVPASVTIVRTLIRMYTPDQIKIRLLGSELDVQDKIEQNISNYLIESVE